MAAALRFSDAGLGYRGAAVLRDVHLELPVGRILALVGPNGAGKSTLIKAALGLAQVVTGTAEVLGRAPARARADTGYVPQLDALDPDFPVSARQVVLMGLYRRIGWWRPTGRVDRSLALQALDQVGLADRAGDRFGLLSGGQRQRVLLARAIVARPRLLLLDEPFNGVDATSQDAILAVLRDLAGAGTSIVVSTHDLGVARDLADLVGLLNRRQWAFGGPAGTLTADRLPEAYGGRAVTLADGREMLVEP
ncbi:metal ABC transporter ATP-binding protein [Micromonosporaceae bacterium Da 78-11]